MEYWLKPWCQKNEIDCIGTKLEIKNGHLTGKIDGNDCVGPEKVSRLKKIVNISDYDTIDAYGDSSGDKELLAMADIKCFKWKYLTGYKGLGKK